MYMRLLGEFQVFYFFLYEKILHIKKTNKRHSLRYFIRLKSMKSIKSDFSHKKHKIQTSFIDAFNKKQKDKRPSFF